MQADPLWMKAFLGIHIAAGFSSFVMAPIALATAKGGKQHRRWGMVYLWSMGVVAVTALPMALYRPVLFLALVAVFSFYAAFSGYRVLKLKDLPRGGNAQPIDWIAAGITFSSSAALSLCGWLRPHLVQDMGIVAIVFGIVGMRLAGAEMRKFIWKPKAKMFWWYTHLGNFIGSYVAAWTAFLVTNIHPESNVASKALWLLPTAIGVPAIYITIGYYTRKFTPKTKRVAIAEEAAS